LKVALTEALNVVECAGAVAVLTVAMLTLVNCAPRRADFTARVEQDCAAGDQWACHLIDALRHPRQGERQAIRPPSHADADDTSLSAGVAGGAGRAAVLRSVRMGGTLMAGMTEDEAAARAIR
jgi:hypothetical protein